MSAEPLFESRERFKGCPVICLATNLPAHESREAALEFHEKNNPRGEVIKIGKCQVCDRWHLKSTAPEPSGSTAGGGKRSVLAAGFNAFRHNPLKIVAKTKPTKKKRTVGKPSARVAQSSDLGELFGK